MKIAVFICLCLSGRKLILNRKAFSPTVIPPATAEIIKFIDHPVDLAYGLTVECPCTSSAGDIKPLDKIPQAGLKANETEQPDRLEAGT